MYFNCVGRIFPIKDGGKLKQNDLKIFDSGWAQKTLNFRVRFGNSSTLMQIKNGYFANKDGTIREKDNVIYTIMKGENGEYESSKVNYIDRKDDNIVKNVPSGRKFTIDLCDINRFAVEAIYNKFLNDQDVRQEDMDKYNIYNAEQAKSLLDKISNSRSEYIYAGDFLNQMESLLSNGDISKNKFRIHGDYEIRYSEQKKSFYKTFVPKKIYLIPGEQQDSVEEKMEINMDFYFNKDGFDSTDFEKTGKSYLNGFTRYYDSQFKNDSCKGNVMCPITIVVNSKDPKYVGAMSKKFKDFSNCEYKCMKMNCLYIDGADKKEITLDDLSEETRSDIACGLLDFEDVKRQFGGSVYGEKVTEIRYVGYDASFGVQETDYVEENFDIPSHEMKKEVKNVIDAIPSTVSLTDDDDEDLFNMTI